MNDVYYFGFNIFSNFTSSSIIHPTSIHCLCGENSRKIYTDAKCYSKITDKNVIVDVLCTWHSFSLLTNNSLTHYTKFGGENQELQSKPLSLTGNSHSLITLDAGSSLSILDFDSCSMSTGRIVDKTNLMTIKSTENSLYVLDEQGSLGELIVNDSTGQFVWSQFVLHVGVRQVSCGKEHCILLDVNGNVWSYGNGSRGQLGNGSADKVTLPFIVEGMKGVTVKHVSAGGWHSVVISHIGDVYVWGWNRDGQLGLPADLGHHGQDQDIVVTQYLPTIHECSDDHIIVKSACGSRHTVLLTDRGQVLSCGWNGHGQLGVGDLISHDCFEILTCFDPMKVIDVSACYWSTIVLCDGS